MEIARRIYLSRMTEKVSKNKEYAERIGMKNKSLYITDEKSKTEGMKA